jgi:hypothetical protein
MNYGSYMKEKVRLPLMGEEGSLFLKGAFRNDPEG